MDMMAMAVGEWQRSDHQRGMAGKMQTANDVRKVECGALARQF